MKRKTFLGISSVALLSLIATACGSNNNSSNDGGISFLPATTGENAFSNVTTFDDVIDVHTDGQKAFIEYEGTGDGYENLTKQQIMDMSGQNSSGSKNISAPNSIDIEFTQTPAENFDKYVVELSMDGKFDEDLKTVEVASGQNVAKVYNLYAGTEYYYRVKALYQGSDNFDVSETYTLKTSDAAPRNLFIDGMTNCRDLGGKQTVDGGYIRQGLLYRTAALDDSQSGSIVTELGKKQLNEDLKVKTEIELRGNTNGQGGEAKHDDYSSLDTNVNYQFIPFAYQSGKNLLYRNIEPVRKVFEVLGQESNYPVFFHCRIGTDRTGLIALLVNGLIGLDIQKIYQDYLFSDFGCIGKVSIVGQQNDDSVAYYVKELQTFPGEKFQNKVYNFLATAGVPTETLDSIINIMTVEDSVLDNQPDKIYVEDVANMDCNGLPVTNVSTLTKHTDVVRAPANAVKFSASGNKVTYAFSSSEAFTADLYANLTSRSTSGSLDAAFKITLNGTEQTLETNKFTTTDLGFGSAADYWIPAKLVKGISIPAGQNNVIEIEAKTSTAISMSQFCFAGMSTASNVASVK